MPSARINRSTVHRATSTPPATQLFPHFTRAVQFSSFLLPHPADQRNQLFIPDLTIRGLILLLLRRIIRRHRELDHHADWLHPELAVMSIDKLSQRGG
jgi:hypothetical protein